MNKELSEVIKTYATKSHKDLHNLLLDKSKDQLIAILSDLLTTYINDKNSSLIREYITVSLAGYVPTEEKIGYNGYKQSTEIGSKLIACEAKPQNIKIEDSKKRKNPRKLNGGGNFTDYTHKRLAKDKKENPHILASGFINGGLIYILEFSFSCSSFINNLKKQVVKRFPRGGLAGQFLRSANFTFEDYKRCRHLNVIYLDKNKLTENKKYITNKFYNFLIRKLKNETDK